MATTRSTLTRLAMVGVLAAGGVGVYVATRADEVAPTVAASIFKTAIVEEGSLGTSEKIDGSVVLSDVTTVLHRIEGQASSSVNSSSSSSSSSGPSASGAPAGLVSASATNVGEALSLASRTEVATPDECVSQPTDTSAPAGPATTSTTDAPTIVPDTTLPDTTGSDTTTPDATAPEVTPPATPTPTTPTPTPIASNPATTPTTDCVTTSTTPGGTGGGGFPTGGTGNTGGTGSNTTGGSSERITQVVTSIITDGSPVALGTVLYSVESSPVIAMAGAQPSWRTLDTSSEDGIDVMQLELSLTALGYDPDGTMTVDSHFDSDTKAVVKAWQEGYGIEVSGVVDLGSVVFVGADITVTDTDVVVGDEVGDGDAILSLSAASRQVVIDVPDGDQAYLVPGLVVKIGSGEGTVTLLRSTEREGVVVVQAVITPIGPIEGANNGSTVTVTIVLSSLDGVLLVPTEALVSRIDGSYAVQVPADDGTSSFVTVELLGVSGPSAAIRGDGIVAGTEVLQPI